MRPLLTILFCLPPALPAAEIVASSASWAHVSSAVGTASDGDTVLIPNGSAIWTNSIVTTKQIIIRAQNYTPTAQPWTNLTRNVVITATTNTTNHILRFTSGNSFHCGVGGIQFLPPVADEQSGTGLFGYVRFSGSGTKPPLLFDCYFVANDRENVTSSEASFISIDSLGAVVWNCLFDGSRVPDGVSVAVKGMGGAGFHITSPRAWTTASTMGTLDTSGLVNVYVEDCQWFLWGQSDVDDNGRLVTRNSKMNGSSWQTHGFTSSFGGRHVELYDMELVNTIVDRNFRVYFWARGGTFLSTNCSVDDNNTGYGAVRLFSAGDNVNPSGPYPVDRQPGYGHNGSAHVSDPVYLWNNTGDAPYSWSVEANWDSHFDLDRDIFANSGAKSGYTKYTYPHPLRDVIEGSDPEPAAPVNRIQIKGPSTFGGKVGFSMLLYPESEPFLVERSHDMSGWEMFLAGADGIQSIDARIDLTEPMKFYRMAP